MQPEYPPPYLIVSVASALGLPLESICYWTWIRTSVRNSGYDLAHAVYKPISPLVVPLNEKWAPGYETFKVEEHHSRFIRLNINPGGSSRMRNLMTRHNFWITACKECQTVWWDYAEKAAYEENTHTG